jgi:hypothetical protein
MLQCCSLYAKKGQEHTQGNETMTALEIINLLKSTRDSHNCALLWVNDDRREAAVHDGEVAHAVDYNDAVIARTDPAMNIISRIDGETFAA